MSDTIPNNGSSSSTGGWIGEKMETVIVVAVMVVTMTFQAAINPPGGITPDGKAALMTVKHDTAYWRFSIWNTVAFTLSSSTVMALMCGLPVTRKRWAALPIIAMWGALSAAAMAYMEVVRAFRPADASEAVVGILKYGVYVWVGASFIIAVKYIWEAIKSIKAVSDFIDFLKWVKDIVAQTKN